MSRSGTSKLLAVLATAMLASCGSPGASGGKTQRTSVDVESSPADVVFWHFWGGEDKQVVEQIVDRFNASQNRYRVKAVSMPGNNLDLKLFLAIAGKDPPDVVNQDDPILADWAYRGAILPLDELASPDQLASIRSELLPAAVRLGEFQGRLYGLCNGLDIRALYYNATLLREFGLEPPTTLADLDRIAETIAPPGKTRYERVGYLPDSRRLLAWGSVFGGSFYDVAQDRPTLTDPRVVSALEWMTGYRERYGASALQAFRQGDQSLPGTAFPLLPYSDQSPHGRYAVIMDGQWRTRDIAQAVAERKRRELPIAEFGVCPLPSPADGRRDAGWVNGNFFLCPKGARNPQGAWAFMKFWCGLDGHQASAAQACADGGWIPVSRSVTREPTFQAFLEEQPLFREFVRLAASETQVPTPVVVGAAMLDRELKYVGGLTLSDDAAAPPNELLDAANSRLTARFQEARRE